MSESDNKSGFELSMLVKRSERSIDRMRSEIALLKKRLVNCDNEENAHDLINTEKEAKE